MGAPQGRTGEGVTYDYAEVRRSRLPSTSTAKFVPSGTSVAVYQIFPDRYARDENWRERTLTEGSRKPRNGIQRRMVEDWNEPPSTSVPKTAPSRLWFYGGSLKGIQNDLPRIAELGFTAIYLNPIFEAASTPLRHGRLHQDRPNSGHRAGLYRAVSGSRGNWAFPSSGWRLQPHGRRLDLL